MTWTYSRHIHLSVRHPWGRVWVEAWQQDDAPTWGVCAEAVGSLGEHLTDRERVGVVGGRREAKKAMQDLAARLAAHIGQARGWA